MHPRWIGIAVVGLLALPAVAAEIPSAAPEAIERWIDQLDSEVYVVRERAMQKLAEAGPGAVEPLARAADEGNLEVASRAVRVLFQLSDSDDPDTALNVLNRIAKLDNRPAERAAASALLSGLRQRRAIDMVKRLGGVDKVPHVQDGEVGIYHLHIGEGWKGGTEGLRHLREMELLRHLSIHGVPVGDKGLTRLHGLAQLERVELFGTDATPEGIDALRRALPTADIQVRAGALLGIRGSIIGNGDGAQVMEVQANTAAHAAGIRPGDVITKMDGEAVREFTALTELIAKRKPGDKAKLEIRRGGQTLEKEVHFGKWR